MYSDNWTDKELDALEARIAEVFKEAEKDLQKEVNDYFAKFKLRDQEMLKRVQMREMTPAEYYQWRITQMGRGQRFEALRDKVAERYTKANEVANAYVNDMTPSIYSLNRNYEAYNIEKTVGSCDFTMWDESTVRRLIVEQPDLMPSYPKAKAVKRGIDLEYGKSQITKHVTSGIIRGLAPSKIANELMSNITSMERANAIRAARTAVTAAQNAGRFDSYVAAEKMGIKIKRRWVCTKDSRTRNSHRSVKDVEGTKEPFDVGGEPMMFPADASLGAHGWNIYNCRCTMRTVEKDGIEAEPREMLVRNPETGEWEKVNEMSYSDWLKWKKTGTKPLANSVSGNIIKVDNTVIKTPKKSNDIGYNVLLNLLQKGNVDYNPVHKHANKLSDNEIIAALAGGDMTKGSCASVGLAYIGQKQGWNVLDFRDGESRSVFANSLNLLTLSKMNGMKVLRAQGASSMTVANRLLKQCEIGKEYYLAVGRHASVVRKTDEGVLQYLELQSKNSSGWTDFDGNPKYTLKTRFGCSTTSGAASTYDFMLDITDSDFNDDFRTLMGFINTEEKMQRKGSSGTIK